VKETLVDPGHDTFDRDLDTYPATPPRIPLEMLPQFQRIIVNPLLGVVTWLAVVALIRTAVKSRSLALFVFGLCLLFAAFFFQQFHCLDCGATGWLFRYRRHVCPAVVERLAQGPVRRWRVPSVKTQMTIWFYLLAGAIVLLLILLGQHR
jgi:hypothetical protein